MQICSDFSLMVKIRSWKFKNKLNPKFHFKTCFQKGSALPLCSQCYRWRILKHIQKWDHQPKKRIYEISILQDYEMFSSYIPNLFENIAINHRNSTKIRESVTFSISKECGPILWFSAAILQLLIKVYVTVVQHSWLKKNE